MAAFEWMELQTLASDIANARSRLAAARAEKDHRLIRTLEQEIMAAEERRTRLVAHITSHLAGNPQPTSTSVAMDAEGDTLLTIPAEENSQPPIETDRPDFEPITQTMETGEMPLPLAADEGAAARANEHSIKGDTTVWDQLTPTDLERAKSALGERHAEMLVRHAEELNALESERAELETLEQAILAFMQKFTAATAGGPAAAAVVRLGDERELRALGRG